MANFLPKETVARMQELFSSGFGIRAAARELRISTNTASKYYPRFGGEPTCPCGLPVRHQGWCSFRFEMSPARQAIIARWQANRPPAIIRIRRPPRILLSYPFVPQQQTPTKGTDLLLLVNGLVPKGLPEQLRGDVCQEIIVAVLSGELGEVDIPAEIKRFIGLTRKNQEANYMAFSIDTPRADGSNWHDIIAAEESAEEAEYD